MAYVGDQMCKTKDAINQVALSLTKFAGSVTDKISLQTPHLDVGQKLKAMAVIGEALNVANHLQQVWGRVEYELKRIGLGSVMQTTEELLQASGVSKRQVADMVTDLVKELVQSEPQAEPQSKPPSEVGKRRKRSGGNGSGKKKSKTVPSDASKSEEQVSQQMREGIPEEIVEILQEGWQTVPGGGYQYVCETTNGPVALPT